MSAIVSKKRKFVSGAIERVPFVFFLLNLPFLVSRPLISPNPSSALRAFILVRSRLVYLILSLSRLYFSDVNLSPFISLP